MAKLMSPGPVPRPPDARPTKRRAPLSGATNRRTPFPEICCSDTAVASAHPPQPDVFCRLDPFAVTLMRLIQLTPPPETGGAGAGAGAGAGDGWGVGAGAGAGV